jgi:hypothetical protein
MTGTSPNEPSVPNILDALMRRRCYSTLDRNCVLLFRVNGAEMGSIIEEPLKQIEIEVIVDEADNDDLTAKIELFEDGVVVQTDEPNAENRRWETLATPEPGGHYYFAKVTQKDGNLLWSAPVWVTVASKTPERDFRHQREAHFVVFASPSRASSRHAHFPVTELRDVLRYVKKQPATGPVPRAS